MMLFYDSSEREKTSFLAIVETIHWHWLEEMGFPGAALERELARQDIMGIHERAIIECIDNEVSPVEDLVYADDAAEQWPLLVIGVEQDIYEVAV